MNALNILSGKSQSNTSRSRTSSTADIRLYPDDAASEQQSNDDGVSRAEQESEQLHDTIDAQEDGSTGADEVAPLLQDHKDKVEDFGASQKSSGWSFVPKRIADVIVTSMWAVVSTVTAPIQYVVACFYDEDGAFSAILPIRRMYHVSSRTKRRRSAFATERHLAATQQDDSHSEKPRLRPKSEDTGGGALSTGTDSSRAFESEAPKNSEREETRGGPAQNTRSRTTSQEEIAPAKRSIRIKLHNDAAQNRRHRSHRSVDGTATDEDRVTAVANSLKSPSSPTVATKLKYPRAPAPPRPLVPRRQPSYSTSFNPEAPKKTLVIDLDETLIHSMAKGNRMSTGHMVEVKFQGPIGGSGVVLGPQVPILYFVHERPHCHEFLRKVSKWYNLIAFTASVQEYADPVVDWLERERKYFSGRYYRQHCTFRNGAYIKDLSQVEPDLSRVMILDNSPMSYIFHEDNAIPIEGWISDPTDNDLLHLVPFLEGLQYATDVRALLALRLGQAERA